MSGSRIDGQSPVAEVTSRGQRQGLLYLEEELGIEALRTMRRIKVALDPNNVMNPRKLIPPH
ncbi:hypothetical protein RJ639_008808, partial [Escallonia herrerae]